MGSKRTLDFPDLLVNADMSSDIISRRSDILHLDRVGYHLSWTGSPSGDFSVEVSNDQITWITQPLSSPITANGSPDQAFIDAETAAKYIRLIYIRSAGTGILQAKLSGKSISG